MKKQKIIKGITLLLYPLAMYLFFIDQHMYSGVAVIVSGLINVFLGQPASEFLVLSGIFIMSFSFRQIFWLPIIAFFMVAVGLYDMYQFYQVKKELEASQEQGSQNDWQSKYREKDWFYNLIGKIIKK